MKTLCFWKGVAGYYDVAAYGVNVGNGAWTYRHPSPLARRIKDHVAFTGQIIIDEVTIDEVGGEAAKDDPPPTPESR